MPSWYPGWQLAVTWFLAVAVAGVIYFVPMTRLVAGLSNHSAVIAADAE
jgi:hypothetical protein